MYLCLCFFARAPELLFWAASEQRALSDRLTPFVAQPGSALSGLNSRHSAKPLTNFFPLSHEILFLNLSRILFNPDSPIGQPNRGDFHNCELLRCRRFFLLYRGGVAPPEIAAIVGRENRVPTANLIIVPRISSALNNRSRILMKDSDKSRKDILA